MLYHAKQSPVLILMPGKASCDRGSVLDTPSEQALVSRITEWRIIERIQRPRESKLRLEQWKSLSHLFDSFVVVTLSSGGELALYQSNSDIYREP